MKPDLTRFCSRVFDAPPVELHRLTSGASMETWAFKCGEMDLILRRPPSGSEATTDVGRLSVSEEAKIIQCAREVGVAAPKIFGRLQASDQVGAGFVMERMAGEALPPRLFSDQRYDCALAKLLGQAAAQLSRIHSIKPPDYLQRSTSENALEKLYAEYRTHSVDSPVIEYAFQWLFKNLPDATESVLLHGDFRMGNILVTEQGLSAVIDWELASVGDPARDLAYFCVPAWRFTRYDQEAGGIGSIKDFLAAYEKESGRSIERSRFDYWLVFGTLWWGVACLTMAGIWREGIDKSIERLVIGTRLCEVELDLLLLLEDEAPEAASKTISFYPINDPVDETGEVQSKELISAVRDWIISDVSSNKTGGALFQARVAANALGIVLRRMNANNADRSQDTSHAEPHNLSVIELCRRLASGELDLASEGVLKNLRLQLLKKLSVDQPKYPGLYAALTKWQGER